MFQTLQTRILQSVTADPKEKDELNDINGKKSPFLTVTLNLFYKQRFISNGNQD